MKGNGLLCMFTSPILVNPGACLSYDSMSTARNSALEETGRPRRPSTVTTDQIHHALENYIKTHHLVNTYVVDRCKVL